MSIEEQLMELVGQHVKLAFLTEEERNPGLLTIEQDYRYWVDGFSFTSEDIEKVEGYLIFLQDEFFKSHGLIPLDPSPSGPPPKHRSLLDECSDLAGWDEVELEEIDPEEYLRPPADRKDPDDLPAF